MYLLRFNYQAHFLPKRARDETIAILFRVGHEHTANERDMSCACVYVLCTTLRYVCIPVHTHVSAECVVLCKIFFLFLRLFLETTICFHCRCVLHSNSNTTNGQLNPICVLLYDHTIYTKCVCFPKKDFSWILRQAIKLPTRIRKAKKSQFSNSPTQIHAPNECVYPNFENAVLTSHIQPKHQQQRYGQRRTYTFYLST